MYSSAAERIDTVPSIVYIESGGLKAAVDMYLVRPEQYGSGCDLVVVSMWGSDIQCRALFARIAQNDGVDLDGRRMHRNYRNRIRYKSLKIGYGKYHAMMWDEPAVENSVVWFHDEERLGAWERFVKKTLVPFDPEWIPELSFLMGNEEGMLTALDGLNMNGIMVNANDKEICDLIVKKIHR